MPELRDYQRLAMHFLHQRPSSGLWMDMGLGKTAVSLSALTDEHLPAMVVAPKRVAENVWDEERDLWRTDLSISLAVGNAHERGVGLHANSDITVISRDNFHESLTAKPARPWRTLIIDEASGYKSGGNKGSKRWKDARRAIYGRDATIQHVWELTGTPSPNGLPDVWAPVWLMDQGQRLGRTLGQFREWFLQPGLILQNGVVSKWHVRPGMDDVIMQRLEDLCLSMKTEGRVDLPPVTINPVEVTLPPRALKAYRDLKKDLITSLDGVGLPVTAANAAGLSNRLSQITAGFLYDDDRLLNKKTHWLHDEKIKAARDIVNETGSPVLIFYWYQAEYEALRAEFKEARTMDERGIVKEWNAGQVPVLLAHPASAGHGLNLQRGGHTMIWTSLPGWNLEYWEQAIKRLARSGQTHPVMVHVLMGVTPRGGTVDHLQRLALDEKADVQGALMHHLEDPL